MLGGRAYYGFVSRIVCPRCGGGEIRQITPGFFRCESETQIGERHAPPGVTGAGFQRSPVFGPCQHEFQAGVAGMSSQCGWPECGRDSIGVCVGPCERRLCGLHGPRSGPFICAACEREQAMERERETEAEQAEAAEAAERTRLSLEKRMGGAVSAIELLEVLRDREITAVTKAACRTAWLRLISVGGVKASHNVVETQGRGTAPGLILSRGGLTAQRGSWSSPVPVIEIWPSMDGDVWLDAEAIAYRRKGGVRLSIQGERRTRYFVLPNDETAIMQRRSDMGYGGRHRWFEVVNGTEIGQDERGYARTLELVLENVCTA